VFRLLVALAIAATAARSATIYVSPSSTGPTRDGSSWASAYASISEALAAASSGDEIWVVSGVYKEAVALREGVGLYGGFRGDEASRDARDVAANVSAIDGEMKREAVVAPAGITPAAVIDGFTIRNGSGGSKQGAAIRAVDAAPTIRNNVIAANAYSYAGIYLKGSGSPVVEGNAFRLNTASRLYGGPGNAVVVDGCTASIRNNVFEGNRGGAISVTAAGALIESNSVNLGALSVVSQTTAGIALTNATSLVRSNTVRMSSPGIQITGGSPTIIGNRVAENVGGIVTRNASPLIERNDVLWNTAPSGAGIGIVGGAPIVRNNVLFGNAGTSVDYQYPSYGAGIYCKASAPDVPVIANNTLIANNNGGAIYCTGGTPLVVNNLIAYCRSAGGPASSTNALFRNNCFWDSATSAAPPTGPDANGNVFRDPKLANASSGDYRLLPDSPCRDAGDDSVVAEGELDAASQPRQLGGHVDIGAYETDGSSWSTPPRIVRVRPDGDDALDGASWESAKRTLRAAVDAVQRGGGEIWAASGTYAGGFNLGSLCSLYGGFAGNETALDGRSPGTAPTTIEGPTAGAAISVLPAADAVNINRITVQGTNITGVSIGIRASVRVSDSAIQLTGGTGVSASQLSEVTIVGNRIRGADNGIATAFTQSAVIDRNLLHDNKTGISLIDGSVTVRNNVLIGCRYQGISLEDAQAVVTNNTVAQTTGTDAYATAIYLSGYAKATFANNIIAFNAAGVMSLAQDTPTFVSNCFYGNGANEFYGILNPVGTKGNLRKDPLLLGLPFGGWRLGAGSPCVDAGSDAAAAGMDGDADGAPRLVGAHVDIGADEQAGSPEPFSPRVAYVSLEGSDTHDGASWQTAKRTIRAAMDALMAADGGGQVWVANGLYAATLQISSFIHLYGGFAGAETATEQRNFAASPTIIDGQGSEPVISAANTESPCRFDGFQVIDSVLPPSLVFGPLLVCDHSSITIANNAFLGDPASQRGGVEIVGGAPTFTNNTVWGGSDAYGGVRCEETTAVVSGNLISHSRATGIEVMNSATLVPVITANVVSDCAGPGISFFGQGLTVNRNTVTRNLGGGIRVSGAGSTLSNNLIVDNRGAASALLVGGSNIKTVNNTIVGNVNTDATKPHYGCIHLSGGMGLVFDNNIIAFNSSGIVNESVYPVAASLLWNVLFSNGSEDYIGIADPFADVPNIPTDPLFVDRAAGDYRLTSASPCIDVGAFTAYGTLDLSGGARVIGSRVDVGAYEWSAEPRYVTADAVRALRIAGGLIGPTEGDLSRLNREPGDGIGLEDAIRLARAASGLN
jgi:hypothetical protein